MIYWSINAARQANCFDKIIVSTDDKEISDIAIKYGAEVPFLRPSKLADDYSSTMSVIKHSTEWFKNKLVDFSNICCLYPATPLLEPKYIAEGLHQLSHFEYCFSALEFNHPIQRGFQLSKIGAVEIDENSATDKRTQDLSTYWHDAGQFYWGKQNAWLSEKQIFAKHSTAIKLERLSVLDIDFLEDWKLAELIFKNRHKITSET
jgi:N-acylneuraminate cytidylyltransferase